LEVDAGIAKHTADCHQLLIVDFQDVATTDGIANDFLIVEALAKVFIYI
jgi:hypothetical protein